MICDNRVSWFKKNKQNYVTASKAGALMRNDLYVSDDIRADYLLGKAKVQFTMTPAMKYGIDNEYKGLEYLNSIGVTAVKDDKLRYTEFGKGFICCIPDGMTEDGKLVEIKTSKRYSDPDELKTFNKCHIDQIQFSMLVIGCESCYYVRQDGISVYDVTELRRDDEYIEKMKQELSLILKV